MKIYDIIQQLVDTGKVKYSSSVTIELRGDLNFSIVREKDYIRLVCGTPKQLFAVTNFGKFGFAIEGIKFYPDKYVIEIANWQDMVLNYSEGL